MGLPLWFRQVIQGRLDEVSARIEHDPELNRVRTEANKAFNALFAGMDIGQMPEFSEWEDRHHFKQGIINERLYLQGMKDGIQLAVALLSPLNGSDDDTHCK
jgi:2,3-bisphosphoglycerate-independent phosphoglycerate mutase